MTIIRVNHKGNQRLLLVDLYLYTKKVIKDRRRIGLYVATYMTCWLMITSTTDPRWQNYFSVFVVVVVCCNIYDVG